MVTDKATGDDLKRFTLFGATDENPNDGEPLGVGTEFPDGSVAVDLFDVQSPPAMFGGLGELGAVASHRSADGPGNDTWVEYEGEEQ